MNKDEIYEEMESIFFQIQENKGTIESIAEENRLLQCQYNDYQKKLLPTESECMELLDKYYKCDDEHIHIRHVGQHHQITNRIMLSGIKVNPYEETIGYFEISHSDFMESDDCYEITKEVFTNLYNNIYIKIQG